MRKYISEDVIKEIEKIINEAKTIKEIKEKIKKLLNNKQNFVKIF